MAMRKDIDGLPQWARQYVLSQLGEQGQQPREPRRHKYNAVPIWYNGVRYASTKEGNFARDLDLELRAGTLPGWCQQAKFVLEGGVIFRCDFLRWPWEHPPLCIDVKGVLTKEYRLKKRMVEARHHIKIMEL